MRSLLTIFFCALGATLLAQATPQQTISAIFDAMRASDTTDLRTYFHPEATLHSVVTKPDGETVVSTGSIDGWFKGMQGAAAGALDEQLHYTEVRTDGRLATAWTPYAFMYQGTLHHCGVNAFQLTQDGKDDQWRILHITDTRRDGDNDGIPCENLCG
ncbi:MAG: excalibur calcium-binding domain-containing protein, partial [Bacteroidota bacterium]